MTRDERAKDCIRLIQELGLMLKTAKISENVIKQIIKRLDREDVKSVYVTDVHTCLIHISGNIYSEFQQAYSLVKPETWAFYTMMDVEGLAEQIILNRALKDFKEEWKKLPKFSRKIYGKTTIKKKSP